MAPPMTDGEFIKRNYRFNFFVNMMDMALFWFGFACIAPSVILPVFVSHFTSHKMLIGLVGVMASAGWFLPQLFTSNWVEKLVYKKDAPVKVGFFTERMPLVILPFTTLLALANPALTLALFFLVFGAHSIGAGMVAVGWQDMVAKIFPIERRGFFFGFSSFVGTATGVVGAIVVARMLDGFAFPYGYTWAFGLGGGAILISWFFLAQSREYPSRVNPSPVSQREYLKKLPLALKGDKNFLWFLFSQVFVNLGGMIWAFMAVYARDQWNLTDGRVGAYNTALLVGQALGNLLGGFLGDRRGQKTVLVASMTVTALAIGLGYVSPAPGWFYLVFALRGLAMGGFFIGSMIVLEMSKPEIRPTYIGVNNTLQGVLSILVPLFGGALAEASGYPFLMLVSLAVGLVGIALTVLVVREPRGKKEVISVQ